VQGGPERGKDRLHIAIFSIRRPEQEQPNPILKSACENHTRCFQITRAHSMEQTPYKRKADAVARHQVVPRSSQSVSLSRKTRLGRIPDKLLNGPVVACFAPFLFVEVCKMMPSTSLPQCWLCGQPCPLEDCTVDENGHAVHESCYFSKLELEKSKPPEDKT